MECRAVEGVLHHTTTHHSDSLFASIPDHPLFCHPPIQSNPQSGLAGLAFDEGSFGVFGYVSKGMDSMAKLKAGDSIVQARVISGGDKLVRPNVKSAVASAPQLLVSTP